jgi:protocatechuate 3,4-dioxygenase alpha subunit
VTFPSTPSQTVGPYFAIGLAWDEGPHAVAPGTPGAITIAGTVYDGASDPVPDILIETWQADPDEGVRGFARCAYEEGDGSYEIITIRPGPVPGPGGTTQAPHVDVSVFARGMLQRCVTRIYLADEDEANAADPVLASVPADRRGTLLAEPVEGGYRFDIHLQGPHETVFFAI